MKRLWVIIFLVVGICPTLNGQIMPFRTYSIEKGLSEAVVNDLIQDQDGYLWIGTSYGLNRFDGINFENYYSEDGLLNNKIFSLYEDEEEQLWIGTGGGVNMVKTDSIYTLSELKPLESSTILSIYQDSYGEYWFATDGEGVWNLDENDNLIQYLDIHGMGGNRVRDILEDNEGVLWFATREGLTKLEDGNFRTFTTRHGLPDNRLRDLELADDGSLWVASRGGLCSIEDANIRCFTEEAGLVNNRIQSISKDEAGNLWLGTEEGVSYFSDEGFTNYSVDEGLTNNIIYATHYDREGNIWFGTFGGGISTFLGNHFKNYTVEQGLSNNVITSIAEGQAGKYWIATYGGGISRIDKGEITNISDSEGLVDNKVYTVKTDEQNRLLIGTRWGFSIYDGNSFRNFDETELPSRKIRALLKLKNSPGIWLGTYGEGLLRYENGEFQRFTEEDGLADNTVMSLEESADGAMWIATYGGVSKLEGTNFSNYSIQDGLPNNGVLDILKDKSGQLWFATFEGIARFENGSFEAITLADGLPDEVCYFIEQDDRGIFWIGTNKGVVRFDYEAFKSDAESVRERAFKLITQDQGLAANEMNAGASFKDSRGHLWFGSVGGVTVFDPEQEKTNNSTPTVHIENIRVSGESISMRPALEIGSDNHNITFEFIGISLSAPEQVRYRYRLKNSGEGWQQTSQRSVRYSALMPGDYTFQVRAQNNDGRWSSNTASINFTVMAPFWLQWWFIGLVILAIAGIVFFVYNFYRVRKMVEIERMRVRIASDLHDDVGSALTEIALQSDFLQTMDVSDKLEHSLQQIGNQSRKIVSSLDDIVWSIDARNDTMGDLTDRMQDYVNNVLPDKQINYHFEGDMDDKLKVSLKENLYLIFKEAINNISKHSNADRVDITLSTNGNSFLLSIKDNGTFASNERKSGQGLHNMKMRAKRVDANVTFKNDDGFEVRVDNRK
jgi:ligand-binding sensor domain-containing protein/two-component sensor histidine kinase